MPNFNQFLIFESENAYDFAYDLSMERNYSVPKIYTANGDLKKRWYVYFSYRNPKTGKLKRVTPFYGEANKYKTKEDRLYVLSAYRKKILELLKQGYNPFEDNSELYQKQQELAKTKAVVNLPPEPSVPKENPVVDNHSNVETHQKTIKEAFDFALSLKKNLISNTTYNSYSSRSKAFQKFVTKNYPNATHINQLTKNMVVQFLNDILLKNSARSRNNCRIDLGSLFQTLEDNEIIASNFIKKIPVLKSIPEKNKTYTKQLQEDIFKYLENNDPILLLYIKFISYNFLRPIEVNRLKIGDINLKEKTISFKAKNSPYKTKIIPDILLEELPDLTKMNPDFYLFTPTQIGGVWETAEENKRDYFSKRFKKVIKDHFKLGKDYGLYSFRHTFITKLYRELEKQYAPFEAKSRLMHITGHNSMTALDKYLRDIDAELPTDYSEFIRAK